MYSLGQYSIIISTLNVFDTGVLPVAVYEQMNRPGADIHEYSVTLGPLQVEIISALPTKVKDLIRLVKYWEDEKMKVSTLYCFYAVF